MAQIGLPAVGLGTGGQTYPSGIRVTNAVATALEMGYRHVDTAQSYSNEAAVGHGIAKSNVDRKEIFLATKVRPRNLAHDDILQSVNESIDRLGGEYVNLLYVHFPTGHYNPIRTFAAFDKLAEAGKVNFVGVSNFTIDLLEEAQAVSDVPIAAVQAEMHPWYQQAELLEYVQQRDLPLVAYCPLIRGKVFKDPVLQDIATKHDISAAQVSLAWLLSKENVRVIVKSSNQDHMRENLAAADVELDETDIKRINAIDRSEKLVDTQQSDVKK